MLLPYLAGCTLGTTPELRWSVVRWLGAATLTIAAIALLEFGRQRYLLPPYPQRLDSFSRGGLLRAQAGFGHPLSLSMFLCLGIFASFSMWRRVGLLAFASVTVCSAAVFATLSRSPLLGLAVGSAIFLTVQASPRARLQALVAVALIVAALALAPGRPGDFFRGYLRNSVRFQSVEASNVIGRENLIHAGLGAVARRPWLGYGFGVAAARNCSPKAPRSILTWRISSWRCWWRRASLDSARS
jgi:O-antigen ligase